MENEKEKREKKDKKKKEKGSKSEKVHKSSSSKHDLKHKKEKKHKKDKKHGKESKREKKEKDKKSSKAHKSGIDDSVQIAQPISLEDYFLKSVEFRVWLFSFKHRYFEDLSTEEARRLFEEDFARSYNSNKLPSMYYSGDIPMEVRQSANKTQHRWRLQLDNQEKERLHDIAEDVDHDTKAIH